MPELPDVEVNRRYLQATSLHRRIDHVRVPSPEVLDDTSPQGLGRSVHGHTFEKVTRHGKYLFVALDGGGDLVLHFGMTGELHYAGKPAGPPPYTACLFVFEDDSSLAYISKRKIGHVALAESREAFVRRHDLGPDVLDLDAKRFIQLAEAHRGSVKTWLMNQQVMAGIGNEYSDEILFQAGIDPRCPVSDMDHGELRRLLRTLQRVLEKAITAGADPDRLPSGFLLPHRHEGGSCPGCGGTVKSVRIGGRRGWYCPACQPGN